jgi:hypothetical protein
VRPVTLPPQPVSADYTTLTEFQIATSAWKDVCRLALMPEGPLPLTPGQAQLVVQYVVDHGADHEDACPSDDTCDCSRKARNEAVSAACRYLLATSEEGME